MSAHSVSARFSDDADARTSVYPDRWPIFCAYDDTGDVLTTITEAMAPADAVRFADRLLAETQKFADAVRAEAARRTAGSPQEAAA